MPLLFPDILFTESNHSYVNKKTLQRYTSVTTEIKNWQKPFPKEFWLLKKSKELGINKFELEKEWSDKGIIGSTAGSMLHLYIENKMKNKIIEPLFQVPEDCIEEILKKYNKLKPQADNFINEFDYEVLYQEAILNYGDLSGQCDLLVDDKNGGMMILDFKTDKVLKESKTKWLGELKHLYANTLTKHSVQVSIYQRMLEEIGIKVSKRIIVWFCENNDNYQLIEVPYLKQEAETILKIK